MQKKTESKLFFETCIHNNVKHIPCYLQFATTSITWEVDNKGTTEFFLYVFVLREVVL